MTERKHILKTINMKQMNIFDRLLPQKFYHTLTLMKINESFGYESAIFLQKRYI